MARYELDYFPPQGTKYKWNPPGLRHLPWTSRISFNENDPRSCRMEIWLNDKGYRGVIDFTDLYGNRVKKDLKETKGALEAVLATEELADKLIANEKIPSWALEAIAEGWRPPISKD